MMTMDLGEEIVHFSLDENNICDQLTNGNGNITGIVPPPFPIAFRVKEWKTMEKP